MIASYTDLTTAVGSWLFGRTDLAAQAPTFVQFAEAKFNRTLFHRKMEQRAQATFDTSSSSPQWLALPPDFQTMRRITLIGGPAGQDPRLTFLTGTQFDDKSDMFQTSGPPIFFTITGDEMEFLPTPDQNYTIEMIYRQNLPPLASNSTNWLLTLAPDVYLYGSLMETAPYLMDDERVPVWGGLRDKGVTELNDLSLEAQYNAGPLVQRSRRRGY